MLHIKFIDTQDRYKEWNMNSWDDTALAEDVLINQVVSVVDDVSWHSFTFGSANGLENMEGYFIIEVAQAYDINPSAYNNGVDISFDFEHEVRFSNQANAIEWDTTSRPFAPYNHDNSILSPSITASKPRIVFSGKVDDI